MPKVRSIQDRRKELERKLERLKVREERDKLNAKLKEMNKK